MSFWLINCIALFALCVLFAGIIIPQILLIAFRKKLFDEPDERKIHTSLVPRLGGIAFTPVIFFSLFLVVGVNLALGHSAILSPDTGELCPVLFGLCAMLVLFVVGIADDLIGVRYRAKFVAQILCACMLIIGGIWFNNFHGIMGLGHVSPWFGFPFTVLLVVFIINAINLIDGIDGLASGLSAIASLVYGVIFFLMGEYLYTMLAFATLGVLLPFFYYNVFGDAEKHSKIFMGDTGSLTIGIVLSILSLRMNMTPSDQIIWNFNPIVAAFIPLFVPCCDVVRVYLHRVRNGKNPFLPDKNHIHHKLLSIGLTQRWAMISLISSTFFMVVFNILMSMVLNVNALIIIDVLMWGLANIWLARLSARRKAK
ncbi:MAG: undecaprenyl/decaprenyl-phosphate alpha-N-acetylglucosaminyl 1-phosphate transferase [Bacteroidales bacterium]|nr:undecaprenyl/decaprenyl-phosphate alpha-N-acetylglucosaminyl 1-phosphate transferase [Bacteroidales bacterium]